MSERPYNEFQKRMMKVKTDTFTDEEKDFLRVMLLPRTKYLPESDEECFSYAREVLAPKEFERLLLLSKEIAERFSADGHSWSAGDKFARLYYRIKKQGKTFCAFALDHDRFHIAVYFNAEERSKFEALRSSFSVAEIQWTYDLIPIKGNGVKCVYYDANDEKVVRCVLNELLPFKDTFFTKKR